MSDEAGARVAIALAEALYGEVRQPINTKAAAWTDEEIRYYLSARWGLRIPPEVEAGRLLLVGLTNAERAAWEAECRATAEAERDALLARCAAGEALVQELTAIDPITRYGSGDFACHFCAAEHHNRGVQHEADCPWLLATSTGPGAGDPQEAR